MHELIRDIALCIGVAWLFGSAAQLLRQPALLAYLVGGFVLGPAGLSWIHDAEAIETISELGLIFLLFMIGLEIDLKSVLSAGRSITVTALVQVGGGSLLAVALFTTAGFGLGENGDWSALYLAVATALSSTIIIVKVLYDKRELDTLPGRITVGVLVLQDVFVILFFAVQPSLDHLDPFTLVLSVLRAAALVVIALAVSRYALPRIFHTVARLPELMLIGAIGWCFAVGELAAALSLSREMGALVAGVALSTFPYALDVTAKVTSLRDFFVTLFFVSLGLKIPLPTWNVAGLALVLAAFTVVSRTVTTFAPLYLMRSGLRHSILPAISLSQISEFSLVVIALGVASAHVSADIAGAVSLAFVLLAVFSTFAMSNSEALVRHAIPLLKKIGLPDLDETEDQICTKAELEAGRRRRGRIMMLGFHRTASSLLEELSRHSPGLIPTITVVDFNPEVVSELRSRGVAVIYGDISHRDTLLHAGIEDATVVICSIPDSLLKGTTNEKLVLQVRELNEKARIIAPAEQIDEVAVLREAGADYVSLARVVEAMDLREAVRAAVDGLLIDKQSRVDEFTKDRREVLP